MATKIDSEFIKDAKKERKSNAPKLESNEGETPTNPSPEVKTETQQQENPNLHNGSGAAEAQNSQTQQTVEPPQNSEFKEKFDDYFKGAGSIIAGETVVNMIDDFKSKLLFIYAKKCKVEIPIEALQMDEKGKQFAAFLVDHAIKNKLFGWVEKNPLLAATGVVAISGVSTYLMIEMLKKSNSEAENQKKENDILKKQIEALKNTATDQTAKDVIKNLDNQGNEPLV